MTLPVPEAPPPADEAQARRLLHEGDLVVEGRLVAASNTTLYCRLQGEGVETACVYKPVSGERPLWDFPEGSLAGREVAAHAVSEASGWRLVPPTVLRDGPFGPGMVQLWVATVEELLVDVVPAGRIPPGWLRVLDAADEAGRPVSLVHLDDPRLRRTAVLDVVLNNADRKGGHLLPTPSGHLHGVDHGVAFHVEPKLRTVLWGWAGRRLAGEERTVLRRLAGQLAPGGPLAETLNGLLRSDEVRATRHRAADLLARDRFPAPGEHWPSIPWPAF
ncbi:MAG TPA: SCO1664 family protein [Jiangellales bacterium]|nr:SCO1664 family protein [Jiangellales bacterium]